MDALKLQRVILRTLVFDRPILAAVLLFIMATGLIVGVLGAHSQWTIYAVLAVAGPAWGLLAAAAFRLDGCCEAAGALGIPGHHAAVRRAQYLLLALFAAAPSIYAVVLTQAVTAPALILLAAAIGVSLSRAYVLPAVAVAAMAGSHFHFDFWSFAATTAGALLSIAIAVAGFALWFRAPLQAHARGVWGAAALADARHETPTDGVTPTPSPALDSLLPAGGRMRPETFWGALGDLPARGLHLTAAFASTWLAVFVAMHFYRHGRSDIGAFLASSVVAGGLAGLRFFNLQGVWATTAGEQALLMLTPRWPARAALKWLVFRSLWNPVPASVVAWLAVAVVGSVFGWLPWPVVVKGAASLVAIKFALFGFLLLFLAQSRLHKTNKLAMSYLVFTGFIGLLMMLLAKTTHGTLVLSVLLLAPALIVALVFCLRRPQFPVQRDGEAVI